LKQPGGTQATAREFLRKLYANVPVLDTGARAALTTFAQRSIGDVLITWENEAYLARREFGAAKFDVVIPSISILAEPSVAVVDKNVIKRNTKAVAEEYLKYLYSPAGQEIVARNFYRPRDAAVAARYERQFPKLTLTTIKDFGGWASAQQVHFGDGGVFDQLTLRKR
jgi:sulfate/thiosulfate transport system substrate-binding protein